MTELFPTEPDASGSQAAQGEAAAYRVLARKYRPSTFAELIGQEAMVRTLTNAIAANRLPQAWMLTGVRGVGKTTTARIVARALNCTGADGKGGPTIEPCGVCDACRAIAEERHVDVLEMDAASRTSVDDIRDIIDGVRYGPVSARYKIYILDEVHMLSKNAFNALLKTLEEPPPHTKFIFATTEIRKVPVTVLSRCQRFDLRRIDSERLAQHFTMIAGLENVSVEAEGIQLIAQAADGSVRDGLSLLDQAIARGDGAVRTNDVKDMLGLADRGQALTLGRHVLRGQMPEALTVFASMIQAGTDPLQTLQDLCDMVHLLTKAQVIADWAQRPTLSENERAALTDLADIKIPALTRVWQILLKGLGEVQSAANPAQAAEMVLIRVAFAADMPTPGDLVKQLRAQMETGTLTVTPNGAPSGDGAPKALRRSTGAAVALARPVIAVVADEAPQPQPQTFREVVALFEERREGALAAQLRNSVRPVRCVAGHLDLHLADDALPDLVNRLGFCLSRWTGQRWIVSVSSEAGAPTIAEEEAAEEERRRARINAHPLMVAALAAFPDATLTSITTKVAPVPAFDEPEDDAASAADVLSLDPNDFEDD